MSTQISFCLYIGSHITTAAVFGIVLNLFFSFVNWPVVSTEAIRPFLCIL